MARFRFHRYTLAESLETEINVGSLQELMDYYNSHADEIFRITKLSCEYYSRDDRPNGYPLTYMVKCEYAHESGEYPLGFSDELLA